MVTSGLLSKEWTLQQYIMGIGGEVTQWTPNALTRGEKPKKKTILEDIIFLLLAVLLIMEGKMDGQNRLIFG